MSCAGNDSKDHIVIVHCGDVADLVEATNVARWGLTEMTVDEAAVIRGTRRFLVRRNKASMTVWVERRDG